ncbi:MAG TPA: CHASE2 domain-containing protein [Bryobacteraceae bacterium]|jgi:hypothetical protein
MFDGKSNRGKLLPALLIAALSASLGMLLDWRAPGLDRYARDWLMQRRGPLPVPSDIAIAAIDEKSIKAFGRFPWPRQVMAKAIDTLKAAGPKIIAADVLFVDPTDETNDAALARSITAAGNVVLGAQLIDSPVHGGPSTWLLPLPSFAAGAAAVGHVNVQVESEGIARQIAVQSSDAAGKPLRALCVEAIRVGDRTPEQGVTFTGRSLILGERSIPLETTPSTVILGASGPSPARLRTGRMTIDYIGPAGSFDPVTFSLVDVVQGVVPAERFHGKYVLIGATAASQGDRLASPFVHRTDAHADQHGALMPGVEVLANALNTILRQRFYSDTSDWGAFFWAFVVAATTLLALERAQGRPEFARQSIALAMVALLTLAAALLEFLYLAVFPPLVPGTVAFASAGILGLLWRNLAASSRLDQSIETLARSSDILIPAPGEALPRQRPWLPQGLEWKAQKIGQLNARLVERAKFVDQALRTVEDGLVITTPEAVITFTNPRAAAILQSPAPSLEGQNLIDRLGLEHDLLRRLVVDRAPVERELEIRNHRSCRYILRMAAVVTPDGTATGIVASLSDVTRQHELQQTKNDVITLVSHEMRTPLTAIQGMTELLANYEMESARRKELSAAINGEVKRLTAMITEYLDITRLESGATPVRKAPLKLEPLLQRTVLMLNPVAAQQGVRLNLRPPPLLPVVFADAGLLARALDNLVSNAIKYSPHGTVVSIEASTETGGVAIAITDQGYGIPEADLSRIFEKFYRVPRVENAGIPGTGLGLALVRDIAELHGGSITVISKVHQGSTFTLRIPQREAAGSDSKLDK